MFIALDPENNRVSAKEASKGVEYKCPVCGEKVELRRGEVRLPHFAHWKNSECIDSWHHDMSEWHYTWQDKFPTNYQEVVVEKNGKKHRADVLIEEHKLVIEFQHSRITPEEFEERNTFYKKSGYHIVWLFDMSEDFKNGKFVFQKESNSYFWKRPWTTFRMTLNQESFWNHNRNDVSVFFEHNEVVDKLINYDSNNKSVQLSGLSDSYNFSKNTFRMWLENNYNSENLTPPICKRCMGEMILRRYKATEKFFWRCVNYRANGIEGLDCMDKIEIGILPTSFSINGRCSFCYGRFAFYGKHVRCEKCGFVVTFNYININRGIVYEYRT